MCVTNFWFIQNNKPVVDRIGKISAKKGAVSLRTFYISTLYTKIPYNLLKEAILKQWILFSREEYPIGFISLKMVQFGGNLLGISR